ncbi:Major intrinsic protein [Trema orientale]|uniref:Major intrinsic protein n=1 Tax=Trema orientale TaxID=63057 RepID=A0A2P5CMG1_TREOI|nr:Major intrinsic protein [Trema orientale]
MGVLREAMGDAILTSIALGGANFNPSTATAFYAAGLKSDVSLFSMAARFPAQAAGGVAGVKALLKLMPEEYRKFLRGPSLKVDLHTGAAAEGVLTFVFCFSVLFVVVRGPKSPVLKVWLLSNVTAGLFVLGSGYTGPSMNPANAFGFRLQNQPLIRRRRKSKQALACVFNHTNFIVYLLLFYVLI